MAELGSNSLSANTTEMKEDLSNIHTTQLLKLLQFTRKTHGRYELYRAGDIATVVYYDDLKSELATRKHIPNKLERKATRKKKQIAKQVR